MHCTIKFLKHLLRYKYYFPYFRNKEIDIHQNCVNWQHVKTIHFIESPMLTTVHQS